jgi:hypothetical protein
MKAHLILTLLAMIGTTACSSTSAPKNAEPPSATASAPTASAPDRETCILNNDSRLLEIKKTSNDGCELFYTKFGTERSVATSVGSKHCSDVREKIKSNLRQSGFKCD